MHHLAALQLVTTNYSHNVFRKHAHWFKNTAQTSKGCSFKCTHSKFQNLVTQCLHQIISVDIKIEYPTRSLADCPRCLATVIHISDACITASAQHVMSPGGEPCPSWLSLSIINSEIYNYKYRVKNILEISTVSIFSRTYLFD